MQHSLTRTPSNPPRYREAIMARKFKYFLKHFWRLQKSLKSLMMKIQRCVQNQHQNDGFRCNFRVYFWHERFKWLHYRPQSQDDWPLTVLSWNWNLFSLWCLWWCLHLEQLATELTAHHCQDRARSYRDLRLEMRGYYAASSPKRGEGNSWKLRLSLAAIPLVNPRRY